MGTAACKDTEGLAEEMAKTGENRRAMVLFTKSADCWTRWESFSKAAHAFERAYEHAMLVQEYAMGAEFIQKAAMSWIRHGEYDKFEFNYQVASDAYILAAEAEKKPKRFIDGAFCAIVGGDLDMARQLIYAAMATTKGQFKELINLALMLAEYHFGEADLYIKAAIARVLDRDGVQKILQIFNLIFAGFVRTTLESEAAVTIGNLVESTGMNYKRIRELVKECIKKGFIPASLDDETEELVVDPDRYDLESLTRRKGPILSRSLKDPGAWDIEPDEKGD